MVWPTIALGALSVVLIVSGCGGSSNRSSSSPAVDRSVASDQDVFLKSRALETTVGGGTPAQQALLRTILRGIMGSSLLDVRIGASPDGFTSISEFKSEEWLYFTVRASDQPTSVRAYWQALLVAGSFRDASHARQLPEILGKTITIVFPGGRTEDGGSSMIDQPLAHAVADVPAAEIVETIEIGADAVGVRLDSVRFGATSALAPEISITTDDAAGFADRRDENLFALVGRLIDHRQPLTDGAYLEVRDQNGALVTVSAYSARTGEGVGWTRADLAARAATFGPVSANP